MERAPVTPAESAESTGTTCHRVWNRARRIPQRQSPDYHIPQLFLADQRDTCAAVSTPCVGTERASPFGAVHVAQIAAGSYKRGVRSVIEKRNRAMAFSGPLAIPES